jgi:hypothetical protein
MLWVDFCVRKTAFLARFNALLRVHLGYVPDVFFYYALLDGNSRQPSLCGGGSVWKSVPQGLMPH